MVIFDNAGHARALAEEGQTSRSPNASLNYDAGNSTFPSTNDRDSMNTSFSSLQLPPSPNRRISLGVGGNTSKVLADLQAGVVNARTALENTKAQLRLSQRTVAQLTRQTEDLKDGRERLRLENEGLNNVVARKERLLQEVGNNLILPRLLLTRRRFLSAPGRPKRRLPLSKPSSRQKHRNLRSLCAKWKRRYLNRMPFRRNRSGRPLLFGSP